MSTILGIETSCDETAAAVVRSDKQILSNVIASHIEEQKPYGGVVPEISSRAHLMLIEDVIERAFADAKMEPKDLDAIAVTAGPGLIGGVIVGVMTAKAMASVLNKPIIAVNHLEGHALTARLTENTPYPYLLLLISGGHCQFIIVHELGHYELLGETLDDAMGECFDKVAKLLSLGYPGGPAVEKIAREGTVDPKMFPIPMVKHEGCDLSFSGLKTAVRTLINSSPQINNANIAASFQYTATQAVALKLARAIERFKQTYPDAKHVVTAGGVAANQYIRARLTEVCAGYDMQLAVPPVGLCTDNAVMIAWAGLERFDKGLLSPMDFEPRARWPLAEIASS